MKWKAAYTFGFVLSLFLAISVVADSSDADDIFYLEISGPNAVEIGDTIQYNASYFPSEPDNPVLSWSIDSGAEHITYQLLSDSSTDSILVTGVSEGTAVIRLSTTTGEYVTTTLQVTSGILVSTIDFEPTNLLVGETVTWDCITGPSNATDRHVIWDVSDPSDCIDYTTAQTATGGTITITTKAAGSFTIFLQPVLTSGITAGPYTVNVYLPEPEGVEIDGPTSMVVGGTIELEADPVPISYPVYSMTWSVVSGAGLIDYTVIEDDYSSIMRITANAAGTVTVSAQSTGGGPSTTHTITIQEAAVPVTSISLSGPTELTVGSSISIRAVTVPASATDRGVTWSLVSGSASVTYSTAQTTTGGILTMEGVEPGTVTIRATANDGGGATATYTVTVKSSGGVLPGPDEDAGGSPSFSFNTIVGVVAQIFFDGSDNLAGLAIMAVVFFMMVAFLANVRAPITYALVPMIILAILFAGLGIIDTTTSFLIIILSAVIIAANARNLVGGR